MLQTRQRAVLMRQLLRHISVKGCIRATAFSVQQQIHTHNTRHNTDYHIHGHNLEVYNSKPSVADCSYCNKLPNNIKQIENIDQFKKKLKELLIKLCYYTLEDYLNEDFSKIGC